MKKDNERIIVGFSGGVDSAITVKLLQEQGLEPVAVFLKMFSEQNLNQIQVLADKLGVELIVKDISNIFEACIVKGFLNEYQNNKTPNPCVKCNFEIKFKILLEVANELGINRVATGHYVQIKEVEGIFRLLKGIDEKKDQSYFLYRLTQKELARIIFPLGDKIKELIKKEALDNNFFKKITESQDICFLGKQEKIKYFLKNNLTSIKNKSGKIEDNTGRILGQHQGLAYYTQGQRRGLALSGGPFYVIGKDFKRNVLLVSGDKNNSALMNREIIIRQVNWIGAVPKADQIYHFKSRYCSQLVPGRIFKDGGNWRVVLEGFQWAVAEGQSLVVYMESEILGGGIIKEAK